MRAFSRSRLSRAMLALVGVIALGSVAVDAKPGSGGSVGSRGTKTYSAPPTTNTAPRQAQQMQRTQPGMNAPQAAGSRFGSGFGGMLMGGLLGAGLFGLLSGSGLFGGLSGLAGFMGLLLQVALIGGIIYLVMAFIRSRNQPAMATAGAPAGMMNRDAVQPAQRPGTAAGAFNAAPATAPLALVKEDYDAFESLLVRIQDAYGREEIGALKAMATPEMVGYFNDEIQGNRRRNVHNLTSDAKLLQGDLSEAWSESSGEYATVAMRYSLVETTVERGTGRVLEGDSTRPVEFTELWTFVRRPGSGPQGWELSAIQQT